MIKEKRTYIANPNGIAIKDMTREQMLEYRRIIAHNYYVTHLEKAREAGRRKYKRKKERLANAKE